MFNFFNIKIYNNYSNRRLVSHPYDIKITGIIAQYLVVWNHLPGEGAAADAEPGADESQPRLRRVVGVIHHDVL